MESIKNDFMRSPVGKGLEKLRRMDPISPFRSPIRKSDFEALSPGNIKQWGQSLSFTNKRNPGEEMSSLSLKLRVEPQLKIRIMEETVSPCPTEKKGQQQTKPLRNILTESLRVKRTKRKLNVLNEDRVYEPIDLSVDLCDKLDERVTKIPKCDIFSGGHFENPTGAADVMLKLHNLGTEEDSSKILMKNSELSASFMPKGADELKIKSC